MDDIDGIIARALEGDFEVIMPHESPTTLYGEPPGGTIRSVFLRDADENLVQCDQRV